MICYSMQNNIWLCTYTDAILEHVYALQIGLFWILVHRRTDFASNLCWQMCNALKNTGLLFDCKGMQIYYSLCTGSLLCIFFHCLPQGIWNLKWAFLTLLISKFFAKWRMILIIIVSLACLLNHTKNTLVCHWFLAWHVLGVVLAWHVLAL